LFSPGDLPWATGRRTSAPPRARAPGAWPGWPHSWPSSAHRPALRRGGRVLRGARWCRARERQRLSGEALRNLLQVPQGKPLAELLGAGQSAIGDHAEDARARAVEHTRDGRRFPPLHRVERKRGFWLRNKAGHDRLHGARRGSWAASGSGVVRGPELAPGAGTASRATQWAGGTRCVAPHPKQCRSPSKTRRPRCQLRASPSVYPVSKARSRVGLRRSAVCERNVRTCGKRQEYSRLWLRILR
jgi:hypothetical protein